jgi:hypothetical protein
MNRKSLAAIIILIIGIAGISGATAYYFWSRNDESGSILPFLPSSTTAVPYVRVYVNSSIFSEIEPEITQYQDDIEAQNYNVDIVKWSNKSVMKLKQNLTSYYNDPSVNLCGAVLVGDMPYALANYGGIFPIDLYLMDLNGLWNNENPLDGVFDIPADAYGDNTTEIFVARINPNVLNNMHNLTAFQNYFQRNHAYRNGTLTRPHSGLLYIDDTWTTGSQVTGWNSSFTAYSNKTVVCDDFLTNRTDYISRYTDYYEWIHLFVHSTNTNHQFDVPLNPIQYVYNTDVLNNNTKPLFFNLFCCSACDYRVTNNLGTQYLFSNNTLTVLGTTKPGGMSLYQTFYDSLKNNKTIGEAFQYWFNNNPADTISGVKRFEFFGMVILGDPFLTI